MKKCMPMQPIVLVDGIVRFKRNAVVDWLLCNGYIDLNKIPTWNLPVEDVEQFWQLLGYSVSGYGELSFIREETIAEADKKADALLEESKR
jgi:hypothetical protein